jgi:hypothetical protein
VVCERGCLFRDADYILVVPCKIDGSLTRSLSRGRVWDFGDGWVGVGVCR